MKILVIVAHPDDEVIGVGGTIAKHSKNGDEVFVTIVSEGVSAQYKDKEKFLKIRRDSCRKALKILGAKNIFFHNLPDAQLDQTSMGKIVEPISKDVQKVKPDRVYTHHKHDLHLDHRRVFEATLVACRTKVKEIYSFEILGTSHISKKFKPNMYVDIKSELNTKIKAFLEYYTEVKPFPNPLSEESLITLAKYRGIESNLHAAEAFECIKRVEK